MDQQATMNGRTEPAAAQAVRRNFVDLVDDLISLGELQVQLLNLDLKEGLQRSLLPLGLALGTVIIVGGSVPLLMMAAVWMLVLRAGLSQDIAFLITALSGLAVAGLLGYLAWCQFRGLSTMLDRSYGEFTQNMLWIRHALRRNRGQPSNN